MNAGTAATYRPARAYRRALVGIVSTAVAMSSLLGMSTTALAAPHISGTKSTVVASPTSVPSDGVTTSTITVTLRRSNKSVVAGKTITVTLASGPGAPVISPASAITDSGGQATFTVKSTTAGTDVFQAHDTTDGVDLTRRPTVTFLPGPGNAGTSTVTAAPLSVVADGATASTVTVTVKDVHSNVVPGKTVTLAQTGGTATASIGPASGPTSNLGTATFPVRSTTLGTATFQATDTTDAVVVTQTATVTFVPGAASSSASTVVASPTSVPADGSSVSTVTVTLKDAYGHPVSGKTITVAKIAGAGSPVVVAASAGSNVTDASGVATFSVTSTTGANDTFQATDTTDALPLNQTVVITFTPNSNPDNSTVVANPTSVLADGVTTSTITVTLLNASSNPVSGKTVTIAKIAGPGSPVIAAASGGSNVTNGSGVATFTVKSTTAGVDTFQATDATDAVVLGQTPTVNFVAGPVSAAVSTFAAAPTSVPDDGASGSTLTATLKDAQGNPVSGRTVTAAKTAGPGSPVIGPASGPSNLAGLVTFAVTSTTAGIDTFQATDTTDAVVVTATPSVTFTLGPPDPNLSTVVANPTSVPANGTTSTITVTLTDATLNPIPGKLITLAEVAGSAVTITPLAGATTTAAGVATFTVSTNTPDSDVFQATDSTDAVSLTSTPQVDFFGQPTALDSTVVANPTSVGTGNPGSVVTVTMLDLNGNAVPGKTVTLAKISGPGAPTIGAASGPSAADGTVTFTVTSSTLGTDTFQATDTTDAFVVTQTAAITFVAGAVSPGTSTVTAQPPVVPADGSTQASVVVTLLDQFGNPVAGKVVTVAKSSGPGTPVIAPTSTGTDTTNGSGVATFTVTSTTGGADTFQATDSTDNVLLTPTAAVTFVAGMQYHPVNPVRVLDTRGAPFGPIGTCNAGSCGGALGAGGVKNVQVTGVAGVPNDGSVQAVVLNVTVDQNTAPSFLTVYPTGGTVPNASNLNFLAGQTVPNLVVVKVGSLGRVTAYNNQGSTHVIFDLAGYYSLPANDLGGLYRPVVPARVLDTRPAKLGQGQTLDLAVAGHGGVPVSGASAVVLNLTVEGPTKNTFLTVYPKGTARPNASNLNVVAGETRPNRVVVPLGTDAASVTIYNDQGSVAVIVDVNGYFTDSSNASVLGGYTPLPPARVLDTRGAPFGPIGSCAAACASVPAHGTLKLHVAGFGGVPAFNSSPAPTSVVLNVTVDGPTQPSFLTVYPSDAALPGASDLNFLSNQTIPNLVVVKLDPSDGTVTVYNDQGSVNVIVDVEGYFS